MHNGDIKDEKTGKIYKDAKYLTKEEWDSYREFKKKKEKYDEQGKKIAENYKQYGQFVWLLYNINQALDWGVTPDNLTKIIYLSTFMDYNNRLVISDGSYMTKEKMKTLLVLKDRKFYNFFNSVTNSGILIQNNDGTYSMDINKFRRGNIKSNNIDENKMRLYIYSVRLLYLKSNPREHKFLSYIYQVIPYVNINYNVICFNPSERCHDKIKSMDMREFCRRIGYAENDYRILKSKMKKMTIDDKIVFSFVDNAFGLFCYINPCLYYAGNKWDEVKILGKFCKEDENNEKYENISEYDLY